MRVSRRKDARLREQIHQTVLRCGMRAMVVPKPGFQRKVAVFSTRYGSIDQTFRTAEGEAPLETPAGIAHFLEHQLFKKEGGQDILMEFGRFGASSNAFTDYTSTTFYFSSSGGFEPSLDLLVSLAFSPYFHPEHVAKEKQIIEQELKMYDDMPDYRAYRSLLGALYREHPVRIDIGGTVESIRKIDPGLLERCYRVFYHPSNMTFVAAGDLRPREVLEKLDASLPPERFGTDRVIERSLPREAPGVASERVRARMLVSRPRVLVGIKDLENGNLLERDLTTTAALTLLFGRTGRFFNRAYEDGLIDDSFFFTYVADRDFGFSVAGGETDDPERLAKEIRDTFERGLKERFKKRDVDRTKRKMTGKYLRAFDSPDGAGFLVLGCVMKGHDPFEVPKAIRHLTPKALDLRLRKHFHPGNLAVSVVEPE